MRNLCYCAMVSVACGGTPARGPAPDGTAVASPAPGDATAGGELRVDDLPAASVQLVGGRVVVWGTTEVPAGSRVQAAQALVDSVTRAELAKFLVARIEALDLDVAAEGGGGAARQQILISACESTAAALPGAVLAHGWAERERDGGRVLVLVGRLETDAGALAQALATRLPPGQAAPAEAALRRLLAAGSARAPASGSAAPAASARSVASAPFAAGSGSASGVSDAAPGWARAGDVATGDAFRFICEGAGKGEEDALTTARAICDDKICKLCGVEIESVVQTRETLKGVDLSRKVIERCRRVRTQDTKVERKSVDCGPEGCVAWVQVPYTAADRDRECKRFADEKFDDPALCEKTLDDFQKVAGFSAASFRERVGLLDAAIARCAAIDVRPTPLMGALEDKLQVGMRTFNGPESEAPSYLVRYWLAPHEPLWAQVRQSTKFVERLQLLRGYLAHKVLIMDIVEAAAPVDLDNPPAIARLRQAMAAVPPDEAYGTRHAQMLGLSALRDRLEEDRLFVDVNAIAELVRGQYRPEELEWSEAGLVVAAFVVDRAVQPVEWEYVWRIPEHANRARALLEVEDHGSAEVRRQRFEQALGRAVASEKGADKFSALRDVLPGDVTFFFDNRARIEAALGALLSFEQLWTIFGANESSMSFAERGRFAAALVPALAAVPAQKEPQRSYCHDLPKRIEELGRIVADLGPLDGAVCTCLSGPLLEEGLSSGNKSDLYDRALWRRLPCVRPLS